MRERRYSANEENKAVPQIDVRSLLKREPEEKWVKAINEYVSTTNCAQIIESYMRTHAQIYIMQLNCRGRSRQIIEDSIKIGNFTAEEKAQGTLADTNRIINQLNRSFVCANHILMIAERLHHSSTATAQNIEDQTSAVKTEPVRFRVFAYQDYLLDEPLLSHTHVGIRTDSNEPLTSAKEVAFLDSQAKEVTQITVRCPPISFSEYKARYLPISPREAYALFRSASPDLSSSNIAIGAESSHPRSP